MKILFCNKYNFPFSGTEVYLFELMELLKTQGHEVALFSMADVRGQATSHDQYFLPPLDFKRDFKTGTRGLLARAKSAAHAIYSTNARKHLRRLIADFQPDIAHVRNIYHHLSPSILWELKAQRVPVLYHLNDFKLLCPAYNLVANGQICERCSGGNFRHVITERCYAGGVGAASVLAFEAYFHKWLGTYPKCVDLFLTPSQFAKEKLMQYGFEAKKIAVLAHFQELRSTTLPETGPDAPILYFGRLSPEKGVADLLQAMQHVPNTRLQIAGEGPQRLELESLAQQLHLANVEFTGKVDRSRLDQMIASARFTILPSHAYETLGKSILESYAWGRPVIASDLGSRRELVQEGETGVLYEVGNVKQLTRAISFLVERPGLAAQMGAAGRKLVQLQYSPDAHYLALMKLYETLISRTAKGRQSLLAPANLPMRVAFIGGHGVASKYSGIETCYEEVGKRLVEMGHEVTVYYRTYFTPAGVRFRGMRLVRLPTLKLKHLETFVHTLLSTIHVMCGNCDVVHYQAQGPALFSFLPRLVGKKTVVTIQGLDWQRRKWGAISSRVLRLGELASARLPNQTVVVSHASAAEIS